MKIRNTTLALALTLAVETGTAQIRSALPTDNRCLVSANAAVIDYGTQSRWQLQDIGGQKVTPGKRILMLSIVCPYTQVPRVIVRGESARNGDVRYGERGSIRLRICDVQLDGKPLPVAMITPDGAPIGQAEPCLTLKPGNRFAPASDGQAAQGKQLTAKIEIMPVLDEEDARNPARQTRTAGFSLELSD